MAAAGAHILVEDSFVSGPVAQQRWEAALRGLAVGWSRVRCAPDIVTAREAGRGDRMAGMAGRQAQSVHGGITYDLVVDTGVREPDGLARVVRDHFFGREHRARRSRMRSDRGDTGWAHHGDRT